MCPILRLLHYSCLFGLFMLFGSPAFFTFAAPFVLIKIPTHECSARFFETLDAYERNLSGQYNCRFLITCDKDDESMNNEGVIKKLNSYSNLRYEFVAQKTPVELFNYGISAEQFDILIVAFDDKEPIVNRFDKIMVQQFLKNFPSADGMLAFRGGMKTSDSEGIFIMGHAYYDRFGYVFNPVYRESCALQELISVAKMLRKYELSPDYLFRSVQYNEKGKSKQMGDRDNEAFIIRRSQLFDLSEEQLRGAVAKDWSILICTMYEREESFNQLYNKLQNQIKQLGLEDRIEILYYLDNRGEHSIGNKRNWLLAHSNGYYINFIDDDDDVSEDYVKIIYYALMQNPDSVGFKGLIAFSQKDVRLLNHSIKYGNVFEKKRAYYRPPNHLNTIKRYIGIQFTFPDISDGEDTAWAMKIAEAGLIKTEVDVKEPYYFYVPSYNHNEVNFSAFAAFKETGTISA